MNIVEQIKCLGAMDDWTQVDDHRRELRYKEYRVVDGKMWTSISSQMPDWLNSYDAIIPLVQKQDATVRTRIAVLLSTGQNGVARCFDYMMKTPSQLCEALLRATENWEDLII